jgi:putative NADH-flavin reductase
MQIALFGGTGRCGQIVVRRALDGHNGVSVLARNASRVEQTDQRLRVVLGDALDRSTVAATLAGTEAAIVLIGMPLRKPGTVMSDATATIVEEMHAAKVDRLLLVSADGAGDSRRELPFLTRLALPFVGAFMAEKERQERIARESDLRWTIVRPAQLTDGPATGRAVTDRRRGSNQVSREDVAAFLLEQLASTGFIREATGLFGPAR